MPASIGRELCTFNRSKLRPANSLGGPLDCRRLAPNPTSRRDHSDLVQFHSQNEIRIELIAERTAILKLGIVEHSIHVRAVACHLGDRMVPAASCQAWRWLLGHKGSRSCLEPRPSVGASPKRGEWGRGRVSPRCDDLTQEANAGHSGAFLGRKAVSLNSE
jgi:hypothetical protein